MTEDWTEFFFFSADMVWFVEDKMAVFYKKSVWILQFKKFLPCVPSAYDLNHISRTHTVHIWRQEACNVYVNCSVVVITVCIYYWIEN